MSKFSTQNITFTTPFEMGSPKPLDGRTIVQHVDDLTNLSTWLTDAKKTITNVSPGLQVYVTDTHETYQYIGTSEAANAADVQKQSSWIKVSDVNTSSDKVLTSITVNNLTSNGVTNNNASVTIDSNDIQLGNDYSGKEIKSGTTVVTPTSADTVNTAVKKIIDIILDDEKIISASENNLNDHINGLSGKTITEITSNDSSVTITKGNDAVNGTISVDLKVDPTKINALDLPIGLKYTPRRNGGNATLQLISSTTKADQTIDVSDFVIDRMVQKVELVSGGTIVRITWNTDTTADNVDDESSGTKTPVYTDVNLKDIAQYYVFNNTASSGSNVSFTTSLDSTTGIRTVSGNVTTIDCGEY